MRLVQQQKQSPDRSAQVALLASLLIHASLLSALGIRAAITGKPLLSPVRLSGQTFDVDALGAPADEEAEPTTNESSTTDAPGFEEKEQTENPAALSTEKSPEEATPPEPDLTPDALPPSSENGATAPTRTENTPSKQAPSPVDPFDQALPGDAPSAPRSSGSTASVSPTGAYGEKSQEKATLDLFAAFLKTLPLAAKVDPLWESLPEGPAGEVEIAVTIDESGKLLPVLVVTDPENPPPPYLVRAVTLNRNFLLHGRFALSDERSSGEQKLSLRASVTKRAADPRTPHASGVQAFGLEGGSPPTGVYFTYFSGQHVQISLRRLF